MLFPYFRPILINLVLVVSASANYDIGVGIADCTGPSVEITLVSPLLSSSCSTMSINEHRVI